MKQALGVRYWVLGIKDHGPPTGLWSAVPLAQHPASKTEHRLNIQIAELQGVGQDEFPSRFDLFAHED